MAEVVLQTVVYRDGAHYVEQCLNIDISSFGDVRSEALANLQEALELYIDDATVDIVSVDAPVVRQLSIGVPPVRKAGRRFA